MSDIPTQPNKKPVGGRPKGSINKRSWQMRHELEAAGFDPLDEMLKILRTTTDPDKRWDRLAWLCRHLYPQLKEVEQLPELAPPEEKPASTRDTEALLSLAKMT